jgi:formylglycine-generating enzyme required for sulfatase activity
MTAVGITLHFLRLRSSVIMKSPPDQLTILLPLNLPLKMIPARSGYFIMGDQETGPERLVQITQPFYIGKYPITQVQWQVVMLDDHKSRFSGDQRPMEMVF